MSGLAEQIKILYDQKLYSNVVSLCNLAVPASDNQPEVLGSAALRSQTLVIYGESLLRLGHARKAESILDKALMLRKCITKPIKGGGANNLGEHEIMSDMGESTVLVLKWHRMTGLTILLVSDVKYLIHECRVSLQDGAGAIAALESVPAKQRSARINMALGHLYRSAGLERSAITAYKEVLRETPVALEAAEALLSLGVSGNEVGSLMLNAFCKLQGVDWHALRGCGTLALTTGKALYLAGDYRAAVPALQRAMTLEPKMTVGVDMLAAAMYREKQTRDLERLVAPLGELVGGPDAGALRSRTSATLLLPGQHAALLATSLAAPEVWVALGYYALLRNQPVRANHLVTKTKSRLALQLCSREESVEALLLRGAALQHLKRPEGALVTFRDVLSVSPLRYEAHAGLLDCYVSMRRMREALSQAASSCKKLNQTPRALALYAQVLVKEPGLLLKAKSALEKAITQDPTYLPAVYLQADILEKDGQTDEAISLLLRHAEVRPSAKLHTLLGEMYSRANNVEKALDHFGTALNYDPKNRQAQDGIVKIDCAGGGGGGGGGKPSPCFLATPGAEGDEAGDTTLDMVAECIEETDTEPDDPDPDGTTWPEIS
ncbi:hypothetical protein B566_EDAN008570 [Ephemera danica]|nr:hypothetical protein B566_EDAN008570 [Ephemera danica]